MTLPRFDQVEAHQIGCFEPCFMGTESVTTVHPIQFQGWFACDADDGSMPPCIGEFKILGFVTWVYMKLYGLHGLYQ